MFEYKEQADDESMIISEAPSVKDDIQYGEDFKEALQKLKSLKDLDPEKINEHDEFFNELMYKIEKNRFNVDPSVYVKTEFLSDLLFIVVQQKYIAHVCALLIIRELSQYKEVLNALNEPEIIDLLFSIASSAERSGLGNIKAVEILTRVFSFIPGNIIFFKIYPIENFELPHVLEFITPLYLKLIKCNPETEYFRPVIQLIYIKNVPVSYMPMFSMFKSVLTARPEEINFLCQLKIPERHKFFWGRVRWITMNEIETIDDDLKDMATLMEALREPLFRQF
ncbi:hypothetical protein TVAGG3_0674980, partial [Trichomonas vaginalis G3]|uniref:hypothetical protein n=1 Tax=Trichomonas vaginalis (strain ATCC PRA-98 / G3) TaxID=412133 RepID=UPI0021E55F9D